MYATHLTDPARRVRRRHLPRLLLAGLLAILAGCGSSAPTPSATTTPSTSPATSAPSATAGSGSPSAGPSGPAASQDVSAIYQTIEQQVIGIRELQPKSPVNPTLLDDAGIKKFVADSFDKDNPPAVIDANEIVLKALGMIPADASLRDLYVQLLGGQVVGLYSPDDKQLYVVSKSGQLGPVEKVTFSHEFTHALQDQNFGLGSLHLEEVGQGDRSLGRLALVEGDAVLSMSYWEQKYLSITELGQLIAQSTNDPSSAQLEAMPAVLRETLLFPYTQGLQFVQGLQLSGGWQAVDAAFQHPPASTEQILHPDKYAAGEQPVAVALPKDLASRLGPGWTMPLVDSMGEFQLRVWLEQAPGSSSSDATTAAAGWGGDRYAALKGPNGSWGVVLRTAWDTAADAQEFEAAAKPVVASLASPASLLPGPGGKERWVLVASDNATLGKLANILGLAG